MFSELWDYVLFPLILTASVTGVSYVVKPKETMVFASTMSWYAVNFFSKATIYYEELTKTIPIIEENEEKPSLSYYNKNTNTQIYLGDDYENIEKSWWKDNDIHLLFLKKDGKYKFFYNYRDLSDVEWEDVDKPFIQVELVQNNEEPLDICKKLDRFNINGNIILGHTFLQWLLWKCYDLELDDDYTLKIFDKDVNMHEIKSGQNIKLLENSVVIVDDSELYLEESDSSETEDEDGSESEGSESDGSESDGSEDDINEGATSD
jgi:hypothetical protein